MFFHNGNIVRILAYYIIETIKSYPFYKYIARILSMAHDQSGSNSCVSLLERRRRRLNKVKENHTEPLPFTLNQLEKELGTLTESCLNTNKNGACQLNKFSGVKHSVAPRPFMVSGGFKKYKTLEIPIECTMQKSIPNKSNTFLEIKKSTCNSIPDDIESFALSLINCSQH